MRKILHLCNVQDVRDIGLVKVPPCEKKNKSSQFNFGIVVVLRNYPFNVNMSQ